MKAPHVFWTSLIVGLILAAAAYPAVTAREHKETQPEDTDQPGRGSGKGPPSNESSRPREAGKIVQSNLSGFDGRYVDFVFDAESCRLTDYRVYNTTLLASIQLPTPCDAGDKGRGGDQHGSAIHIGGKDARIRIHDAPNGLIHLEARENTSIQLNPAAGIQFSDDPDDHAFTLGDLTGLLRVENGSAFEGGDITGKARFWIHPRAGGSAERVEIREAIKERKVAGEIDVLMENGTVSSEVLTYEDVIVRAQRGSNGTFRFLVDGNLTSGRTFVVNLGPGVFQQEKIGLRYWDVDDLSQATEVPITQADDLADVLEITEGEGPEYWVTTDDAGKHVLVAVPSFSVHVFEIASIPPQVVPIVLWGFVGGVAFVALGAAGMFRRRGPL